VTIRESTIATRKCWKGTQAWRIQTSSALKRSSHKSHLFQVLHQCPSLQGFSKVRFSFNVRDHVLIPQSTQDHLKFFYCLVEDFTFWQVFSFCCCHFSYVVTKFVIFSKPYLLDGFNILEAMWTWTPDTKNKKPCLHKQKTLCCRF
jgi:hypothetical protein